MVNDILHIDHLIIDQQQTTCILGPSGSGKTTLLKLLNKLSPYDYGSIYYLNKNLDSLDSLTHRRNVLLLSQTPIMFKKTIKDNLLIGLELTNTEIPPTKSLLELMEKLKLNKQLEDDAHQCSLGEKQRIALGRILLMNPAVYLMDEPSASLDDASEKIIMDLISNHTKSHQQTLIMVTHNQSIAKQYADTIIQLESGRIV